MRRAVCFALATLVAVTARAQSNAPTDLAGTLALVGERVDAYYQRAQSIICVETVQFVRMDRNFSPEPHIRRLVYDLRVSWDKSEDGDDQPAATVLRTLRSVDGKPPKPNDKPECLDPKPVALDPLSFLLPRRQHESSFTYKGIGKAGNGRTGVMIDYAPALKGPAKFEWHDNCLSVDIPQHTTGRIWVDRFAGDVLRIDETVTGPLDAPVPEKDRRFGEPYVLTVDRVETSIRYRPVTFTEPDEIIVLPESIEVMTSARGVGQPHMRTTTTFSDYRRFVTGGRIVSQ